MKSIIFAKRNLKEILRDPLSLVFCFAFPVVLLLILELIISGIGGDLSATPQFEIRNLSASIAVFSFSFLTLFSSMLIAKDRQSSFQTRLLISPMKSYDFILGYMLPLLPIAFMQAIVSFAICIPFGLPVTWNLLLAFVGLIPAALLFIGFGLLIGSVFSDKAASGVSSIVVNMASLLGGMFFPLELLTGTLTVIASVLPFWPALQVVRACLTGNFSNLLTPLLTLLGYVVAIFVLAIILFTKKMKSDKK